MSDYRSLGASSITREFKGKHVLVVGDAMLDVYLNGEVRRISPEAPVPVLSVSDRKTSAGGAANVAANIGALGAEVTLVAVWGNDDHGHELLRVCREHGINTEAVVVVSSRPTTVKTRVVATAQQIVRLDTETTEALCPDDEEKLYQSIQAVSANNYDVVIVSDYEKGVLTNRICRSVINCFRRKGVPVLVDPKGVDYERYRGATAVTPNEREALSLFGLAKCSTAELAELAERYRTKLELDCFVITRGARGIVALSNGALFSSPARARKVFDVSGAGDTTIAALALSLAAGATWEQALDLANIAAGIVVGRIGTSEVLSSDVDRQLRAESAIVSGLDMKNAVELWRKDGDRIVFTNGCFDLLHAGHVRLLQQARSLGDRLIVGVNSDASVRRLKGSSRPINNQDNRSVVLSALSCVDMVVVFETDTPLDLIVQLAPDVLCKGSDYREDQVVGADFVRANGGEVISIPLEIGLSTTALIRRAQDTERK